MVFSWIYGTQCNEALHTYFLMVPGGPGSGLTLNKLPAFQFNLFREFCQENL